MYILRFDQIQSYNYFKKRNHIIVCLNLISQKYAQRGF